MELGLFTCPYQFGQLEQAFKDACSFGYDFIELWGGRPHAYCYDLINKEDSILSLIKKYKMPVKVYTPEHNAYPYNYMLGDEAQWQACMEYFRCSLNIAKNIGAEYVLISIGHGLDHNAAANQKRLVKSLLKLHELARETRQKIILETLTPYESNVCTTLNDYKDIINRLNSDYIFPMVDLVVPYVQNENPSDYIKAFGNKLKHIHLVDSDGISDNHLIPGDGTMNMKEVLQDIRNIGFNGTATIELVTHYISDPTYYSEKAINKTKELLL